MPWIYLEDALASGLKAALLGGSAIPPPVDPQPIIYDYIVTNDGDATTANSMLWVLAKGTLLSGKLVGVDPLPGGAPYSKKTFSLPAMAQPVTFKATGPDVRQDRLKFEGNSASVVIDGISMLSYEAAPYMVDPVVEQFDSSGPIHFKNVPRWSGCLNGDPYTAFDPTKTDYPEYGHVRAVVNSSGTITGGTVINSYIGSNWTGAKTDPLNGTITFDITRVSNSTGTGASNITIQVVDGHLQGNTISVGNGGINYRYDLSSELETLFKIPGAVRFADKLKYAFQVTGRWDFTHGRATFENCFFTLLRRGIVGRANTTVIGCRFDSILGDNIQLGGSNAPTSGAEHISILKWNLFTRPAVRGTDYGQPHCDLIQLGGNNVRLADWPVWIEGNFALMGLTRGSAQCIFLSDMVPPYGYTGRVCNNVVAGKQDPNTIAVEEAKDIIIYGNTAIRWKVDETENAVGDATINFPGGAYGTVIVGGNIAENYAGLGSRHRTDLVPNVTVLADNAADYSAKFNAPHSYPMTIADALVAYRSIGAWAARGAIRTANDLNPVAQTVSLVDEPTGATFDAVSGAAPSTTIYSTPAKIVGGAASVPFTVTGSGMEVQFADNLAFDQGVTAPSVSGVAGTDKWARMKYTTGAAGSVTANGVLTLNGYANPWSVTTASVLSFVSWDNQATAWSKMSTSFTTGTHNKLVLSCEVRLDATTNKVICGRSASNDQLVISTGNVLQLILGAGTNLNLKTTTPIGTGWVRITIVVDMPAGTATVMFNNSVATLQTATVNPAGSLVLGTLFSGGWGVFGPNTGSTILDGAFRYLYWHSWSGNTYSLPDLSTQAARDAFYNKFSADLINLSNGSGPLGVQPLGFWRAADLTEANGTIPNRGSVAGCDLVKQAGTYV